MIELRKKVDLYLTVCMANKLIPCQEAFFHEYFAVVQIAHIAVDYAAKVSSSNSHFSLYFAGKRDESFDQAIERGSVAIKEAVECAKMAFAVVNFLAETLRLFKGFHVLVFHRTNRAIFDRLHQMVTIMSKTAMSAYGEACAHNDLACTVLQRAKKRQRRTE
jgi:hypothetical protein